MTFLLALVGGFSSGVFVRSVFTFGWEPIVFALLLATIFIVVPRIFEGRPRLAYSLGVVFFIFAALGMGRALVADHPLPEAFARDLHHRVSYEGVVVADPDIRDANQRVEIRVSSGDESTTILAVASRSPTVAVGDTVRVFGTLALPEPFASEGGRTFRYDKYLERDGVRFLLNYASISIEHPAPWYSISAALAHMKHAFIGGLQATLPEPYSSLAAGIVIGGKTGLGNDLQNAFVRSGLVQIIVLSGYNVMVVAEWVMAALAFIKLPRRMSAAAGALAIAIFVGVAGASATALRAALMAFIALYARATGRTYTAGRALLVAVFLMLLWNPLYLAFDPGFGLSVAATAGIIYLSPLIERLLSERRAQQGVSSRSGTERGDTLRGMHETIRGVTLLRKETPRAESTPSAASGFWKNALATTLAAQIAVLPLLLYDTGNLSLVAIPANLFIMPFMPLAMGLSALAGFAGMVFGTLAPLAGIIIALPAYLATAYTIAVARTAAALPAAAFTLPAFPFWIVLAAYAALAFVARAISKRSSMTPQLRFLKNASTYEPFSAGK